MKRKMVTLTGESCRHTELSLKPTLLGHPLRLNHPRWLLALPDAGLLVEQESNTFSVEPGSISSVIMNQSTADLPKPSWMQFLLGYMGGMNEEDGLGHFSSLKATF